MLDMAWPATRWTWRTAAAATQDTGKQGSAKLAMVARQSQSMVAVALLKSVLKSLTRALWSGPGHPLFKSPPCRDDGVISPKGRD
jgi:hypothetical protein